MLKLFPDDVPIVSRRLSCCIPTMFLVCSGSVPILILCCSEYVPTVFLLRSLPSYSVPIVFRWCSWNLPVLFRSCEVPTMFLRCSYFVRCLPIIFKLCSSCAPRLFLKRFECVSNMLIKCPMSARMFPWCSDHVRTLSWIAHGLSSMFLLCTDLAPTLLLS